MTTLGLVNDQKRYGPLWSLVMSSLYRAMASAVSDGRVLTNFRQAGVSKVSPDGSFEQHLRYTLRLGMHE